MTGPLLALLLLASAPRELASVATEFDLRDEGRSWNIALAASRLDGLVLPPGRSLSFNRTVGPRGLEEGFRPAPELVDGDRVEGIGGGVCQVASTLYAAALEAGLAIEARQAHSRPSRYLPPGLDATVSHSHGVDLVLRNDSGSPLTLRAAVSRGRLTVEIHSTGAARTAQAVEIETAARPEGLEVTVFRLAPDSAGAPQRELVSRDLYR